jgi:hypothetical protein
VLHLSPDLVRSLRRLVGRVRKKQRIWMWMRADGTFEVL